MSALSWNEISLTDLFIHVCIFLQLVGVLSPKLDLCMQLQRDVSLNLFVYIVYFEDFFMAICKLWCVFLVLPVL